MPKIGELQLIPRHRRFLEEYLKDLNGTQAYLRVYKGCNRYTAEVNSHRLLKRLKPSLEAIFEGGEVTWKFIREQFKKGIEEGKPSDKIRATEVYAKIMKVGGYAGEGEGKAGKEMDIQFTGWAPPKALGTEEEREQDRKDREKKPA